MGSLQKENAYKAKLKSIEFFFDTSERKITYSYLKSRKKYIKHRIIMTHIQIKETIYFFLQADKKDRSRFFSF